MDKWCQIKYDTSNEYCLLRSFNKGDEIKSNKLAVFDFDNTLITFTKKTKSKDKTINSVVIGEFRYKNIPDKLKKLHNNNYKIIIVSNQKGLSKKKITIDELNTKLELINKLKIPIEMYISIDDDIYRKPMPTIWHLLQPFNNNESFYCGDSAGRVGDYKDYDLKFAHNMGVNFYVPEFYWESDELFPDVNNSLNKENVPILIPIKCTNKQDNDKSVKEITNIINNNNNNKLMVLLVGPQGSGKSYIAHSIFKDFSRINRDQLITIPKCLNECKIHITNNKNVIIDNTNPSINSRSKFIELFKKHDYKVLCIDIKIDIELAKHNIMHRYYNTNGINNVPFVALYVWYKQYQEPTASEKIDYIIKYKFYNNNFDNYLKYYH